MSNFMPITKRNGVALIMVIIAMAAISLLLAVMAAQIVTQRQMVRQRHQQLQAEWLIRAGVEYAAARLLDSPNAFSDDKQELALDSRLSIVVTKAGADAYDLKIEAKVGIENNHAVVRTTTARFRRTDKGGTVRLERTN